MKYVWVLHVKASELEFVFAYLNEQECKTAALSWGKHATIYQFPL